jgi:hypothetical protein
LDQLESNALPIGRQAELLRFLASGQEQRVLLARGAIFNHCLTPSSLLHHHGQIPTVPAQGGRAVGLAIAQMAQRQNPAALALLKQHRGAASPFHKRGQQPAVAAEGGLLA